MRNRLSIDLIEHIPLVLLIQVLCFILLLFFVFLFGLVLFLRGRERERGRRVGKEEGMGENG